jgi:hypothetical protein
MGRFTVIVDDDLDMRFRIAAIKKRVKLRNAFEQAMELWLSKYEEN